MARAFYFDMTSTLSLANEQILCDPRLAKSQFIWCYLIYQLLLLKMAMLCSYDSLPKLLSHFIYYTNIFFLLCLDVCMQKYF